MSSAVPPIARRAAHAQAALIRAGAQALREAFDDSLDVDDDLELVSADGFAVDIDDIVPDSEYQRFLATAEDALRLLYARLTQRAVSKTALLASRERHGEDALLVALGGVADALVQHHAQGDKDIVDVHRARADTRTLLQSPSSLDRDDVDHATTDLPPLPDDNDSAWERGSTMVARALASAVDEAPTVVPSVVGDDVYDALLRVRAPDTASAKALQAIAQNVTVSGTVRLLSSSPDELLATARGHDAQNILVRTAAILATGLPEGTPLTCALVATRGDITDDVVAANALLQSLPAFDGGRLVFDEAAFAAQRGEGGELAELPGQPRTIDPRAPYGSERWEQSALLARPSYVGRDDDITACADVLKKGGDKARCVVLGGAPGIGKSALLRRALDAADYGSDNAPLCWGAADPQQPTPYAAIVGMIRALARAPAGHPRAAHRVTRLIDGLAEFLKNEHERQELRALGDVARELLGASGEAQNDEDDLADRRSPRALRTSIRRLVLLLSRALERRSGDDRPVVFVIASAEAMDAPTRDTLLFLAKQLGQRVRFALLSTSSKLKLPTAFDELMDVTRRDVRPLDDDQALSVTAAVLDLDAVDLEGDLGVDADVKKGLRLLAERAKGSPLFCAHVVRWAVEGGYLTQKGLLSTGWSTNHLDSVSARVPSRIDKLLAARVQRLPSQARQVLGHCAALGSAFLPAAVFFVGTRLGLSLTEVQQAVRLLTETGFLAHSQRRPGAPVFVDDDDQDDALLVFEHPLLRAAAEGALSDDESKAVHGVVADAIEAFMDTSAVAPRLARHHKLAERRRQAVAHLVTAVRRARRLDDRQGAVTMAREALELVAPDERDTAFTLQLELSAVLELSASQGDKAQRTLKDALKQLVRAADKTGDPARQALALSRVARFNLFLGDVDKAEEAALRALTKAREGGSERAVRDVLRLTALIRFAGKNHGGASRALDEARKLTPPSERRILGGIEHQTGLFHLESNDPLGALEHLLVAFSHKLATADLPGEAACLDAIADVYVRTGHLWTALSLLVRALSVREAIGDDAGFAQSLKNRADVLLMAGDIEAACDEAQRARALAKSLGLDRMEHQAAVVVARAELSRKDAAAAEAILDNVRRRVDDARDPFSAMESELLSARAKYLRAQQASGGARDRLLKTALQRAKTAVELGEKRGFLSGQVLGSALIGEVLLASGDASQALPHAQRAAELLDDRTATGLPVEEALSPYIAALRAMGDDDEANIIARRAHAILEERAIRLPKPVRERFWAVPARQALLADAMNQ